MLRNDYEGQSCSIARALEIVGERWTLLIIRDALLGLRRFDQFQDSLGIARNVLTDRLNRLVEEGILDRVRYSERPERYEYRLTAKGRDLAVTLAGLRQWGDKYLSEKPPRITRVWRGGGRAASHRLGPAFPPRGTSAMRQRTGPATGVADGCLSRRELVCGVRRGRWIGGGAARGSRPAAVPVGRLRGRAACSWSRGRRASGVAARHAGPDSGTRRRQPTSSGFGPGAIHPMLACCELLALFVSCRRRHGAGRAVAASLFAAFAPPHSDPGLARSG